MVAFADVFALPTRAEIKARLVAFVQGETSPALDPPLPVTSWVPGDPSERWIEIIPRAIDMFLSNVVTSAVRAFFFDLNTDPGDAGDLSADQTPRAGWLSAFGSGWWGVQRGGKTYATGSVLVTNTGATPSTFAPFDLTFQRSTAAADGGFPTYRNNVDDTIYTGLGGTLTLAPSAFATLPILADQAGTYANASPGEISVVVTGSFGTLTVSNANPVLGSDREERATYITRARQQSASASPNGPSDAYRYASTTGADGNPLQLWDGSGVTTVNRVYVSESSSTNDVTIYLANPSGPASTVEVSSANGNINGIPIAATDGTIYNPDPIGVVPGTVVLGPTVVDTKTQAPGPAPAVATPIGPIAGTVRIKAVPGMANTDLLRAAQAAIADNLSDFFASPETAPIGGVDQTAGSGFVYTADIGATVRESYPVPVAGQTQTPALYGVDVDVPAGAQTVITLGRVPQLRGNPTISAATNNGSGLVRLTVSSTTGMASPAPVQIYDAETTGGLVLNGIWTANVIDATHIDLLGSTSTGGLVASTALLSTMVLTVV